MASTINSTTSGAGGLITTGDAANVLKLQTGGTDAVTIDASQNVAVTGDLTFNNGAKAASTGKSVAMAIVFGA